MTAIDQLSNRPRDFSQTINKCKPIFKAFHLVKPWIGSPDGTILSSYNQKRKLWFRRYAVEPGAVSIDEWREFIREPAEILARPKISDPILVRTIHL